MPPKDPYAPLAANDPWLTQGSAPPPAPVQPPMPQPQRPGASPEPGLGDPLAQLAELLGNGAKGVGAAMYNNFGPPGLGGAIAEPIAHYLSDTFAPMSPEMIHRQDARFDKEMSRSGHSLEAMNLNNERLRQIFAQPLATAPNPRTYQLPQQPTPAAPVSTSQLFPQPNGGQQQDYLSGLMMPPAAGQQPPQGQQAQLDPQTRALLAALMQRQGQH